MTYSYILKFENDVNRYGTQTTIMELPPDTVFENDVNRYGTQTNKSLCRIIYPFENDVNRYGTQTIFATPVYIASLRMM